MAISLDTGCRRTGDSVRCWGINDAGQLGNGTTETALAPQPLVVPGKVLEIAVGTKHMCARIDDGRRVAASELVCWGRNAGGQLGDGTRHGRPLPAPVLDPPAAIIQLAAGADHTCALTSDGAVYCWGTFYLKAVAPVVQHDLTPVLVEGLESDVVEIASGGSDACARKGDGSVVCWGEHWGAVPRQIVGLESAVTAISVSAYHACAIRDASALCWGENFGGQLGDGTTTPRFEFHPDATPVVGLTVAERA